MATREPQQALLDELRRVLIETLRLSCPPASLEPDADLFGDGIGLDSVDAVQVIATLERHYRITITDADLARYRLTTLRELLELLATKRGR